MTKAVVYHGHRADWVGKLAVLMFSDTGTYVRYLGLTEKDHGHYPMVAAYMMPRHDFYKWFKKTDDSDTVFAKIYSEHARIVGITGEAAHILAKLTPNDNWNIDMAKKTETAPAKEPKAKVKEPKVPTPVTAAKEPKAVAAKEPKVKKEPVEKKPRESVSAYMCELIMANATSKKPLSDDEIFAKAMDKFPDKLDESKRGYIAWNRNKLIKSGTADVPGLVGGPKPRGPKAAKEPAPVAAPAPAKGRKKAA